MDLSRMIDCHVHSRNSFDAKSAAKQYLRQAASLGLGGFSITDHCEITESGKSEHWSFRTVRRSVRETKKQQENAFGIKVLVGIELGQPLYHPETAEKVLESADFDVVLASVHYLRDNRDFYYLRYNDGSCDAAEIYSLYLDEIIDMAERADFDSLAHMTYPLRYIIGRDGLSFDDSVYDEKYDRILKALVARGKALEINTSGTRRENCFVLPDVRLVKRFHELGGKYVTIGSDAHTPEYLAVGFAEGAATALEAGFSGAVYYEKRRPVRIELK